MFLIDQIAECKILEALERGELEGLPGEGKPLELTDERFVPPELRAALRLLKNAGYLPLEVTLRKEIRHAESLLGMVAEPAERDAALRRLQMLRIRLSMSRGGDSDLRTESEYGERLINRFSNRTAV